MDVKVYQVADVKAPKKKVPWRIGRSFRFACSGAFCFKGLEFLVPNDRGVQCQCGSSEGTLRMDVRLEVRINCYDQWAIFVLYIYIFLYYKWLVSI